MTPHTVTGRAIEPVRDLPFRAVEAKDRTLAGRIRGASDADTRRTISLDPDATLGLTSHGEAGVSLAKDAVATACIINTTHPGMVLCVGYSLHTIVGRRFAMDAGPTLANTSHAEAGVGYSLHTIVARRLARDARPTLANTSHAGPSVKIFT
jgi:hypothetical protein